MKEVPIVFCSQALQESPKGWRETVIRLVSARPLRKQDRTVSRGYVTMRVIAYQCITANYMMDVNSQYFIRESVSQARRQTFGQCMHFQDLETL